ncbi:MAG: ECF transporter S component, partial [Clostridia bacterium]|nr:ECF transporter S component [Clostridia bacterium]
MKYTRKLVITAIMSALAFVLMLLEFSVPFVIPDFIKFDFSELPALICAFAVGPIWGGAVCLIKNL